MRDRATSTSGLYVVVVNWNGGEEDNARCLQSIVEQGVPLGRIVFVDNGSNDGSREAIGARFDGLVQVDHGANLGFGEGANAGAARALELGARCVAFVNNDLWFPPEESVLAGMCEALTANEQLGAVGPRVLFGDGTERVWCAGGRLDYRQNVSTLLGNGQPDGERWARTSDVDYVPGCALVTRAEVLRTVGDFRADYFAYMEDVELGLRMHRAGLVVRILGEYRAYHAPSSATGGGYGARRKWMQALNSVRFMREYGTPRTWARFALFDVATLPALFIVRAIRGDARAVLAKAKGILDGFCGRRVTAEALRPGASSLWRDGTSRAEPRIERS